MVVQSNITSFECEGVLLKNLESLDLSYNQLDHIAVNSVQFPALKKLYLQGNKITSWSVINSPTTVELLNLSSNPLDDLCSFKDIQMPHPEEIILHKVGAISKHHMSSFCESPLPSSVKYIDVQYNQLSSMPNCDSYFQQLELLKLDVRNNLITAISNDTFKQPCYQSLKVLMLDHNRLFSIDHNFNQFLSLNYLSISHNLLQHLPDTIVSNFMRNSDADHSLILNNNPWSCDCLQKHTQQLLKSAPSLASSARMICQYPNHFRGADITTISTADLVCTAPIQNYVRIFNESALEYEDGRLTCLFGSVPRSSVTWLSPDGVDISEDSEKYTLEDEGRTLVIHDVHLGDTGVYT